MDHARRMPHELGGVLARNIEALLEARAAFDRRRGLQQRIADAITGFTGSMPFVYAHALVFGFWLLANLKVVPGVRPWDPFPFVMLAMIASVEAIFLSTFVLISQNRAHRKREVLADHQWELIQTEERQNEELLDISRRILEVTREIHRANARPSSGPPTA